MPDNKPVPPPIECEETTSYTHLFESLVRLPQLQQYYPVDEVKERGTIVFEAHESMPENLQLKTGDLEVEILTAEQVSERNITAFLRLEKLEIGDEIADVELSYKTQGVYIEAQLSLHDCEWTAENVQLVER